VGTILSSNSTLTVLARPVAISVQPQNISTHIGNGVFFSVTATGTAPIAYQWQKNGVDIVGATSSRYHIPPTKQSDNGGIYSVQISNMVSSVLSAWARLSVLNASVSAGFNHSLALKADGTVWAWGDNVFGQLGYGGYAPSNVPIQVSGLTGVVQIAAGHGVSMALKSDGSVWTWGAVSSLGTGANLDSLIPVMVSTLSGIVQIATSGDHSFALKNDGTVWAWGFNDVNQINNSAITIFKTPVQITGLSGVVQLAAGVRHSVALIFDGTIWAWGSNTNSPSGGLNGTPTKVANLTGVEQIFVNRYESLIAKGDGSVWRWGMNTPGDSGIPTQISGLNEIVQVNGAVEHVLVLRSDGTAWAWGNNTVGQLGNPAIISYSSTAVLVSGLAGIMQVSTGGYFNLSTKSDGTVWAWGSNLSGQLGTGDTIPSNVPVQILGFTLF
jgi:alpha-tubulin suppressor-like RCC1 family protein